MRRIRLHITFALVLMLYNSALMGQVNSEVEAEIAVLPRGSSLLLNILAVNKTDLNRSLMYKLSIVRNEEIGEDYAKEAFEKRFVLSPGERKTLQSILFDAENEPRTIVFILILEDGEIIGKDRIVINGIEGEDTLKPMVVREDDFKPTQKAGPSEVGLMRGIVVEDTKTKPGRDFYRMFYGLYNQYNINGDRIVKVKEELAIGGNTEITILIDQEVIVRFFVNPQAAYLEEIAKQAVARVASHFEMREKFINQQQRY
jgi:hypothetical protein